MLIFFLPAIAFKGKISFISFVFFAIFIIRF